MSEVSLVRLYVIRVFAVLAVAGLFENIVAIFGHAPMDRGVHKALLGGLWLMALLAVRYPLKMLPVILFEMVWKLFWLMFFGIPQYLSGTGSPRLTGDLWGIGAFPAVCALVIPWSYVWRHYVKAPAEPWR